MPMLSFSHRTTAPAMATEPWEEERKNTGPRSHPRASQVEINNQGTPWRTILQCGCEFRNKIWFKMRRTNESSHTPPVRSRQVHLFLVYMQLWSAGHGLT